MKAFERIFLYSVLAILVFYVFLVDNNAESQVAIQEEIRAKVIMAEVIRAKCIVIANDAGQEVVRLWTDDENNGAVMIYNNSGNLVAKIGANYGGMLSLANKDGKFVAGIGNFERGGMMVIFNEDHNIVTTVKVNENDNGEIVVFNKSGKVIGSLP